MKLMDIDADTLNIPDTEYDARVILSASEFSRIVRDLSLLGESVRIEVSKEGVRFASDGEAANGSILLRQADGSVSSGGAIKAKTGGDDDEDEAEGSSSKKAKVKKEKGDDDVEMDEEEKQDGESKPGSDGEGEEEKDDDDEDDDEEGGSKKRKKKVNSIYL